MTYTHFILDRADRVVGTAVGADQAATLAVSAAVNTGRTATTVEIATADIATLARIAQADDPRLSRVGEGILGAGTHPAQPYLSAMLGMHGVGNGTHDLGDVRYGYDDGRDIVLRFLDNVSTWRGDTARTVKARLRQIAAAA